jgi:NAD(P)-dependent dehydrogenase (short-subunit alcohol dehydrogenase family)
MSENGWLTGLSVCSIISNSSVTTFRGTKSMVDYASTKGAIVGFTRSLAVQLIPKGIRVNAVA